MRSPFTDRWALIGVALLPLFGGCDSKPRAPVLEDSAVFHSSEEGLRFLVPRGWYQRGRAIVPSGTAQKERMLVQYMGTTAVGSTALEVSVLDALPDSALAAHLAKGSHGSEAWKVDASQETFTVNGVPATRYVLHGKRDKQPTIKEVVTFRRGDRMYFIFGIFASTDTQAREQVRASVASILWK